MSEYERDQYDPWCGLHGCVPHEQIHASVSGIQHENGNVSGSEHELELVQQQHRKLQLAHQVEVPAGLHHAHDCHVSVSEDSSREG